LVWGFAVIRRFGYPKSWIRAIVELVTTAVRIAGVPWPLYKLVALAVAVLVLVIVGVATASIGSAVVAAFASATVVWLALSIFSSAGR
jgi:hypothetical protein